MPTAGYRTPNRILVASIVNIHRQQVASIRSSVNSVGGRPKLRLPIRGPNSGTFRPRNVGEYKSMYNRDSLYYTLELAN